MMDKNILLICSEPFQSTWAYISLEVLKALRNKGYKLFFLYQKVEGSENYETFIDASVVKIPFEFSSKKIIKIFEILFPLKVLLRVLKLNKQYKLFVAHSLTPGYVIKNIIKLFPKSIQFVYNVHDAVPHPNKNKKLYLKEWLLSMYLNYAEKKNMHDVENLSTNSRNQQRFLKSQFSNKNIYYFRMPLHIPETIKSGKKWCPELSNDDEDYILFFGRIRNYKGIDILIEAYRKSSVSENKKLVIAGTGQYDHLGRINSANIIFIHRHIEDSEIHLLFKKARCVVYPYTSITQTAVVQFPYYFKVPVIASDLDYFTDCIIDGKTGFIFKNGNIEELSQLLEYVYSKNFNVELMRKEMSIQLEKCYSNKGLGEEIVGIYEKL